MSATGPLLRFCPESNDLLYPQEDAENRRLVFKCRNCGYTEAADPSNWCVYRWVPLCQKKQTLRIRLKIYSQSPLVS